MDPHYRIEQTDEIMTPAVVVFEEIVDRNLDRMLAIAGRVERLRPHCKTHKMPRIIDKLLRRGITRHKVATFAEAEMLVETGVRDVFLAYSLVGPNVARAVAFRKRYPDVQFAVTADDPAAIQTLGAAMEAAGTELDVLLDLDSGQHRTGVAPGPDAVQRYVQIAETDGLRPGGLHLYDGQNHQADLAERREAVLAGWRDAARLRDELVRRRLAVPRIVCGGTGSFPVFAGIDDASIELSPGTCIFHDAGYGERFPDLDFTPAALLLTRVISRPTPDRVTFDLGYKAVASDPPAERRVVFPDLPDARIVLQNEEHLVVETAQGADLRVGDAQLAIPRHICPTSALHKQVYVVRGGQLRERWDVTARDRWLTI